MVRHRPGNDLRSAQFSHGRGQAPDCILIFLVQGSVAAQYLFLGKAKIVEGYGCRPSREHIENINPLGGHRCQVISLGCAITAFVFPLSIGFDTTDFTKSSLGQSEAFALFP
ncbi:hypothetical protein ASF84_11020 [Pseudomonas sp. Leaf127]|nr:hypothetical protein ASF84_11020 [Pseudomonas sp. Leaf127]